MFEVIIKIVIKTAIDSFPVTHLLNDKAIKLSCCLGVFYFSLVRTNYIFVVSIVDRYVRCCYNKEVSKMNVENVRELEELGEVGEVGEVFRVF